MGRKRFLLHVTYLSDESKYSFTLRVTGITRKKAIGEYLDYQIPVSQLNPKGNGDMQAARRNKMRHLPAVYRYKALWALEWAWQLFLNVMGVRVGVAKSTRLVIQNIHTLWGRKRKYIYFMGSET